MKTTWTMRLAAVVFAGLLAGSAAVAAPPQSQNKVASKQRSNRLPTRHSRLRSRRSNSRLPQISRAIRRASRLEHRGRRQSLNRMTRMSKKAARQTWMRWATATSATD